VRREWEPEDLIACWTLVEHDERELVAYKRGATRLGFALMLKFFEIDARFPRHVGEYPPAAVDYVARQVGVDPGDLADDEWSGRTFEYHRAQIRRALRFRRFSEDDEAKLAGWLAEEIAPVELSDERLREALLLAAAASGSNRRDAWTAILGAARAAVSDRFTTAILNRLTPATIAGLDALAGLGADGQDPANGAWLAELKADPGLVWVGGLHAGDHPDHGGSAVVGLIVVREQQVMAGVVEKRLGRGCSRRLVEEIGPGLDRGCVDEPFDPHDCTVGRSACENAIKGDVMSPRG